MAKTSRAPTYSGAKGGQKPLPLGHVSLRQRSDLPSKLARGPGHSASAYVSSCRAPQGHGLFD